VLRFREGVGGLEMRKTILTLSLTKIKQNAEKILKTYEQFIVETYVNFLIGVKKVRKIATPQPRL